MIKQIAFISIFSLTVIAAHADELIINGGFETGDFTGWTTNVNNKDELTPYTVDSGGGGGGGGGGGWFSNTSPLSGNFNAYNGFDGDGGLKYSLYQDVTIPTGYSATLSTNFRIQYDSLGISSSQDRIFDISVSDINGDYSSTLYTESVTLNDSSYTDLGWKNQTFDLSGLSGSTIRLSLNEYVPENWTGPANIEFDDISLDINPIEPPRQSIYLEFGEAEFIFGQPVPRLSNEALDIVTITQKEFDSPFDFLGAFGGMTTPALKSKLIDELTSAFSDFPIDIVTIKPEGDFSTLFLNTSDNSSEFFENKESTFFNPKYLFGKAETVDITNANKNDNAVVFINDIVDAYDTVNAGVNPPLYAAD